MIKIIQKIILIEFIYLNNYVYVFLVILNTLFYKQNFFIKNKFFIKIGFNFSFIKYISNTILKWNYFISGYGNSILYLFPKTLNATKFINNTKY